MEDSPVAADGVEGEMEKGKKKGGRRSGRKKREGKCVVCFLFVLSARKMRLGKATKGGNDR